MKPIFVLISAISLVLFACGDESASAPPASVLEIVTFNAAGAEQRTTEISVKRGTRVQFAVRGVTAQYVSMLPFGEAAVDFTFNDLYQRAATKADSAAVAAIGTAGQQLLPSFFRVIPELDYKEGTFNQVYNVLGTFHPKVVATNVSFPKTEEMLRSYSPLVTVTVVP